MFRWFQHGDLPPRAQIGDVHGILVIGTVAGGVSLSQIAASAQPLPLPWRLPGREDVLGWLSWSARLPRDMVGREEDLAKLLGWAKSDGEGVRARLLYGDAGTGKTRLAAELADRLRGDGWSAGFANLGPRGDSAAVYHAREKGTLVLIDYPEERLVEARELIGDIARLEGAKRLRILLLSRHGYREFWQREIDRVRAERVFDDPALSLGPLSTPNLHEIILAAQHGIPAALRNGEPNAISQEDLRRWLGNQPTCRRPLFALALAVQSVLEPDEPTAKLSSQGVLGALARREVRKLRNESAAAGYDPELFPRLTALAAIAGGLNHADLVRFENAEDTLAMGLNGATAVLAALGSRAEVAGRERKVDPPTPDLLAAALVTEVLRSESAVAPERLWAAIDGDPARRLEHVGRLAYDAEVTLGYPSADGPSEWLRSALAGNPGRCEAVRDSFSEGRHSLSLARATVTVWNELLEEEGDEVHRAGIHYQYAKSLANAGDYDRALGPARESVRLWCRLVRDFADGLGIYSRCLSASDQREQALQAIEASVELRQSLENLEQELNPEEWDPQNQDRDRLALAWDLDLLANALGELGKAEEALERSRLSVETCVDLATADHWEARAVLAQNLNTLSNRLTALGKRTEALEKAEESVRIRRELAESSPDLYEWELAKSLNTVSERRAAIGHDAAALAAARESVNLRRRLADYDPGRFSPELALALNNLSVQLSRLGERAEALRAIEESVRIRERLAQASPVRHLPSLAQSLGTLSNRMADQGDHVAALEAIRKSIRIYRQLVADRPKRFRSDLAINLNNLSIRLHETGEVEESLEAISESVSIWRQLADKNPSRHEPHLAWSLLNLAKQQEAIGNKDEALENLKGAERRIALAAHELPESHYAILHEEMGRRRMQLERELDGLRMGSDSAGVAESGETRNDL